MLNCSDKNEASSYTKKNMWIQLNIFRKITVQEERVTAESSPL